MKKLLPLLAFFWFPYFLSGQSVVPLDSIPLKYPALSIQVTPLATDSLSSSFHILIYQGVPAHYHAEHTELVYVLAGAGEMRLGDRKLPVKGGDFIHIPRGTVHAVRVTSEEPMEVLSIQTPQFDGTDRIWVHPPKED